MQRVLDVALDGEPRPKRRPRVLRSGRSFTPRETMQAEQAIRWQLARVRPVDGPLSVEMTFYLSNRRRVDCDNLQKLVLDAANGVVWKDDSQIERLLGVKVQAKLAGVKPHTRLVVDLLEGA